MVDFVTTIDERPLQIGELAAQTGLSIHTLRYYERIGLLQPVGRAESGHRRYPPSVIERVESLGYLRASGMSIQDMRTYLENVDRGQAAAPEHADLLEAHAEKLAAQIAQLQVRHDYIAAKAGYWRAVANGEGDGRAAQRQLDRARALAVQLR